MKIITQLLFVLLFTLSTGAMSAEQEFEVQGALSYSDKMVTNRPIDVGLEVRGVRLESVYFSENMEALVILWNKTPATVRPEVGIALFDKAGKLLATGYVKFSIKPTTVRAGKQKNYKLHFDKFVNNYSNVDSFQIVFSIVKQKSNS